MISRLQHYGIMLIIVSIVLLGGLILPDTVLSGIGVDPTITEMRLSPGHARTGTLRVANGGEATVLVNVEVEDWLVVKTGQSVVDVRNWLFFDETEFEVEPGKVRSLGYQVIAPQGIEGELVAMAFFASKVPGGGTMNITGRFGVAIYVGIEGTEVIEADVIDIKANYSTLVISIENQGNVHIRPFGRVLIRDLEGELIHEEKIPYTAVIFAGKKHAYPVDLDKLGLSPGEYSVEAKFSTGNIFDIKKQFSKTGSFYLE